MKKTITFTRLLAVFLARIDALCDGSYSPDEQTPVGPTASKEGGREVVGKAHEASSGDP